MKSVPTIIAALCVLACAMTSLIACSGGDASSASGGGSIVGVYTSVDAEEVKAEFKSDGTVIFSMGDEQGTPGTYTVEGEKIIVDFNGQKTTFIRDGDCIEDAQRMFGRMCKGGRAGNAANVSTRAPPPTTGTWVATNDDGTFTIDFKPGEKFSFSFTPVPGSQFSDKPEAKEGSYVVEGDTLHTQLDGTIPMVLKWVNGQYESMAFGLPMIFRQR